MEAKSSAMPEGRTRRILPKEALARCVWRSTEREELCDLAKVLAVAPAHTRSGLALWLQETATHDEAFSDAGMEPERFPQRRSTRLMIPHTAGNSDRVLFSVRHPESGAPSTENALPAHQNGAYQVSVHGERRVRRTNFRERFASEETENDFAGVPAPAWIVAHQSRSKPK